MDKIDQLNKKSPNNPFKSINYSDLLYLKLSILKRRFSFKDRSSQLAHQKSLGLNSKNIQLINKTIIKYNNQFLAIKSKTINNNLFLYQNTN